MTAKEIAEAWKDTGTWIPAETVKQLCRAYLAQERVVEAARHLVKNEPKYRYFLIESALTELDDLE